MRAMPSGWRLAKLGAIGHLVTGSTPPAMNPEFCGEQVPFFKPADLDRGPRISRARQGLSELGAAKARLLPKNSVLVTCIGATIGKSALCVVSATTNQQINAIVVREDMAVPEWVYWWTASPDGQHAIVSNASATTLPILNKGRMAELQLPVPPINEQRRIVERIDALNARSRRAKRSLDAIPPLVDKLRRSVLAAAFRGDLTREWRAQHPNLEPAHKLLAGIREERRSRWEETELAKMRAKGKEPKDDRWKAKYKEPDPVDTKGLPELPEGWCWASLEEVAEPGAEIVYGIVQPGKEVSGGVPYVRGKDIQDGKILIEQLRRTSADIAKRYDRASLVGGDVLLGIIRATKVAIVPDLLTGGNITQGTVRIRPSSCISTAFLAGALEDPSAQARLHRMYRGIDMPGLNVRDVRRLAIPLAPAEEQRSVEQSLAQLLTSIETLKQIAATVCRQRADLDNSVLAAAFQGKLVTLGGSRRSGHLEATSAAGLR